MSSTPQAVWDALDNARRDRAAAQADREAVRRADAEHGHGHGVCRVCGCTEHAACVGGCGWIEIDLCSRCVGSAA